MSENKKQEKEVPFEIPVGGSLGLLALGAVGFTLWRKKKEEVKEKEEKEKEEKQKQEKEANG
jgi:hypothetical protein